MTSRPDLDAIRQRARTVRSLPDDGESTALGMLAADTAALLAYVAELEAQRDHYRALGVLPGEAGEVDLHAARQHAASDDDQALAAFARAALPILCDEITRRDQDAEQARFGKARAMAGNARLIAERDRLREAHRRAQRHVAEARRACRKHREEADALLAAVGSPHATALRRLQEIEEAARQVVQAVDRQGPRPDVHQQAMRDTWQRWPTLGRAVDRLRKTIGKGRVDL